MEYLDSSSADPEPIVGDGSGGSGGRPPLDSGPGPVTKEPGRRPSGGSGGSTPRASTSAVGPGPACGTPGAAFADADRQVHRAALETELLAQPPLDEPAVPGFEEPRGEQHEMRRPDPCLRGEKYLR